MSNAIFPALPWGWSVQKNPTWSTRRAKHVSGREVALSLYAFPLWAFELTFEVLSEEAAIQSYQTMVQFFLARRGGFDPFLFQDPSDCQAYGQLLGAGDGATTDFTFLHPWGAALGEPVGYVNVSGINVYLNGSPLAADAWSVALPSTLVLDTAPGAGVQVSADYGFYFKCRFDDDVVEMENFMDQLWSVKSLKFTSIKP
jgi:uncharacterized protein (TIGR02217 family)